jgi:hypothetical protein
MAYTLGLYEEVENLHPDVEEYEPRVTVAVARQEDPEGYEPVSAYSVLEELPK